MKRKRGCDGSAYEELIDAEAAELRLQSIAEAALTVEDYGRVHDRIVAIGETQPSCRPGLRANLTDRAYAAELATRSLLSYHLDALNELRDAGAMGRLVEEATSVHEQHDWDWRKILDDTIERGGDHLGIDPAILKRAAEASQDLDLKLMPGSEGTIGAELTDLTGERQRFQVRGRPRAGDLARVSTEQLLGGAGLVVSMPLVVASDCHHRGSKRILDQPETIDLYRSNVIGLAHARETIYLHARTIEELGPSAFRGEDLFTAAVVAVVIVGVIFVGAGAVVVANGDPRGWGLIALGVVLIGGAICFASGACTLAAGVGPVHIIA